MRICLINPNQWGRGITHLWIASHSAVLTQNNHTVKLFDCTFYTDWSKDEIGFNTLNGQYKPTDYSKYVTFKENVRNDLQLFLTQYRPDLILVSAISSHIHGEGEYINIETANELLKGIDHNSIILAGGIQPTADTNECITKYPFIDAFLRGDSEETITYIAGSKSLDLYTLSLIPGVSVRGFPESRPSTRVALNTLPAYDYSIFDKQVFYRAFEGTVIKAADFELSRGCPYTCNYCVESVIQNYYGFSERNQLGVLRSFDQYLTCKDPLNIIKEMTTLNALGVTLLRCQDTNFLTIPRDLLKKLVQLKQASDLGHLQLYIETRPESINPRSIRLLQELNVIGVGMGLETAAETYREQDLNRYSSLEKIKCAFSLLKSSDIKRSSYNIIGLPSQSEEDILATIELNKLIQPDNITVSYYSAFSGTLSAISSENTGEYSRSSLYSDSQLRTNPHSSLVSKERLLYYKANFTRLCREPIH